MFKTILQFYVHNVRNIVHIHSIVSKTFIVDAENFQETPWAPSCSNLKCITIAHLHRPHNLFGVFSCSFAICVNCN